MSKNRFHTKLQEHEFNTIRKLRKKLGKSYSTIFNYIKTGNWPAEVCLDVYRLTDGEITATRMRPEVFANLPAHVKLTDKVLQMIQVDMSPELEEMCIFIMNCIQELDCVLYDKLIDKLSETEMGERILNQRMAHLSFGIS